MLAIAIGALPVIRFLFVEFSSVSQLSREYPVVVYEGPDRPFHFKLQSIRPPGWVPLSQVSRLAVGAILVSEDWAFYRHPGYDSRQIKEALEESWEEGRLSRGASTITQQVVKNVFLSNERNLWRKIKELILAVRLESAVGKRRILEVYLNIAEWGEGIFGIGAASRYYFGKHPGELTAREGAFLAMLLPSPKKYAQSFRARKLTDYARGTLRDILLKMAEAHYLTDPECMIEQDRPLSFEIQE